jgi:flagellum-specific peptidoglycan hydrolase FlgJ
VLPQPFRAYPTLKDAFDAHGLLIATGAPYGAAFEQWEKDHDLPALITGIARHYATDPHYAEELLGIIRMPVVVAALATMRKA